MVLYYNGNENLDYMEIRPQTSFIPKKPLVSTQEVSHRGSTISFFSLISIVIFVVSLAGAGGVYAWSRILTQQEITNQETLKKARDAFDPSLILELKKVSNRLTLSKQVLSSHIALSEFFKIVEAMTLKSVRFKNFSFSHTDKEIRVTMSGEAENFSSIALQSDVLGKSKDITDPIISNLALETNGNVSFEFTGTIDPKLLSYASSVANKDSETSNQAATSTDQVANPSSLIPQQ